MEDIRHVAGPVREAAVLPVLGLQDEVRELVAVDPVELPQDGERREDPPRVAHVGELPRAPVQPAAGAPVRAVDDLALGEPEPQAVGVDVVEGPGDLERPHAAEDLPGVALGAWNGPVPTVKVLAAVNVLNSFLLKIRIELKLKLKLKLELELK